MIRNNLDVGIVLSGQQHPLDNRLFLCDAFNTESRSGVTVEVIAAKAGLRPCYIGLPPAKSVHGLTISELDLAPLASNEKSYLDSVERALKRQRRDALDVFGHNGILGVARAHVRMAYYRLTGEEPDRAWPPALPQRRPEAP